MKYGDRKVIASKVNSRGVRVYIPEKLYINGIWYVNPWTFTTIKVNQVDSVVYSFNSLLSTELLIDIVDVSISEPFTAISLQKGVDRVLKHNPVKVKPNTILSKSEYYALLEA